MTAVFRYVPIHRVPAYLAMGWHDLGPCPEHHGFWSHLMQACACNPNARKPA